MKSLKNTLQVLKEHKFSNYEVWLDKVHFLGSVVSKEGVLVDPIKVKVICKWPTPTNIAEIRTFLGFTSYNWRLEKDFQIYSHHLQLSLERTKA